MIIDVYVLRSSKLLIGIGEKEFWGNDLNFFEQSVSNNTRRRCLLQLKSSQQREIVFVLILWYVLSLLDVK